MTVIYSAVVSTNFPIGTEATAIELDTPAGIIAKIRAIRITFGDGTNTASNDEHRKVRFVFESAGGTGGTSYTPIARNANGAAAGSTTKVHDGVSFTVGTVSTVMEVQSHNNATDYFWQAVDEDDKIVVSPGNIFAVAVTL